MPGIDGGAVRGSLILIRCVAKNIVELSLSAKVTNIKFAYCIPDTVPTIGTSVRVAGVRGFCHPDAYPANRHRSGGELDGRRSSFSIGYQTKWKGLPETFIRGPDGIISREKLHRIMARVRIGPCNANRIHTLNTGQIKKDPLRIFGVILAGKCLAEVGIALPVRVGVAVGQAG